MGQTLLDDLFECGSSFRLGRHAHSHDLLHALRFAMNRIPPRRPVCGGFITAFSEHQGAVAACAAYGTASPEQGAADRGERAQRTFGAGIENG